MQYGYGHLRGLDPATRLSFRSIHIYLLFTSLLNLAVAPSANSLSRGWARVVGIIGSALVLLGPIFQGIAFEREPLLPIQDRAFTVYGVILSAVGVMLLAVAHWGARDRPGTQLGAAG